ncbi:hypothetical protein RCC89_18645 [Cytophagaceae bacterium ABcell3]|nr:hypothetical protein RCC89_18645 [Cytophagaceae bacterium ABcell3]
MVNFSSISALFLSLFMGAAPVAEKETKVASEKPLVLVEDATNKGGVLIDDFSTEIWSWWDSGSEKWDRERDGEVLKVKAKGVGKDYECFGKQFDPIDFTKNPVMRLKIKSDEDVKVRIDLKDVDGFVANAKPIVKTIEKSDEFQTVEFDFTGRWTQSWPDKQEVDAVEIVELLVFLNPGGPAFSGTVWMDDIIALPAE